MNERSTAAVDQRRWAILTTRFGGDLRSPTPDQLRAAAFELENEALPRMTEADYAEHPSAWLRSGTDDGPTLVLEFDRHGRAKLEHWADSDFETQVEPPAIGVAGTAERMVRLWTLLADGDLDSVKRILSEQP